MAIKTVVFLCAHMMKVFAINLAT